MTDEERSEEGSEEPIEDLEAPAEAQEDVAGGRCFPPTGAMCVPKVSCKATVLECPGETEVVVVRNQ
jgi:hypothetical protein